MTSQISKLTDLHPQLIEAVKSLLYAMSELRYNLMVVEGVSQRHGHERKADGHGYAVRLAFRGKDDAPDYDIRLPWLLLAEAAKTQKLTQGTELGEFSLPYKPQVH